VGIVSEEARQIAEAAGLTAVMTAVWEPLTGRSVWDRTSRLDRCLSGRREGILDAVYRLSCPSGPPIPSLQLPGEPRN
jgi:hypothetical protein